MLIPGEQRDLSRSPTSPLPACFLHYTLPPTIVSPFPSLRRVDARCRGERHAAFWPARSCSKTSLTCAVRSVLSFDTFPIGLVVACPVRIYRANPDLPPFWSRRRFRLVAKPSAAVLTDRAISRPPIDRTSPGNMFENARSARFYVDSILVRASNAMFWSIPDPPFGGYRDNPRHSSIANRSKNQIAIVGGSLLEICTLAKVWI